MIESLVERMLANRPQPHRSIIMNVTFTTSAGIVTTVKSLKYAFPKKGNAEEGFHLIIDGEKVQAATTGGGKYPKYTYFIHDGVSYYLPKNVNPDNGTTLTIEAPTEKPAEVAPTEKPKVEENAPRSRKPKAK
jgi:hypothetical protein